MKRAQPKKIVGDRGSVIRKKRTKHPPSTFADEKAKIPRGMKYHSVKRINCPLTYQKWRTDNDEHEQKRWYVLGAVKIAFVCLFTEGSHKSGNVQVFMNSRLGNGGSWFDSIREAKAFIISELKKDMNE